MKRFNMVSRAQHLALRAIPRCDQCQMLAINGVNTHEIGCPNSRKTWMPDRQEWVRFVECRECGSEVEAGEPCCDEVQA